MEVHETVNSMEVNTKSKNESLVLVKDRANNIIVFGTKENLEFAAKIKTLLLDGTLQYCTKHFLQMFTIHSIVNNDYVPLLFCLLPNKQISTYKALFRTLVNISLNKYNIIFNPKTVVINFE